MQEPPGLPPQPERPPPPPGMEAYYSTGSTRPPTDLGALGPPTPARRESNLLLVFGYVFGLVAVKVVIGLARGEALSAYEFGYALGQAISALAIAALIRWVYLKATQSDGPIVNWATLAIALFVVTPLSLIGRAGAQPPTEEEVAAAFVPITGYTYQTVPEDQLQQVRDAIASEPELEEGIAVFDARQILVANQPVAAIVIMGIDPDEFTGSFRQDFLDGFRAAGGQEATTIQLNGEEAYAGQVLTGRFIAFFDETDGLVFMVIGLSEGSVKQIAEEVHKGNLSTT